MYIVHIDIAIIEYTIYIIYIKNSTYSIESLNVIFGQRCYNLAINFGYFPMQYIYS